MCSPDPSSGSSSWTGVDSAAGGSRAAGLGPEGAERDVGSGRRCRRLLLRGKFGWGLTEARGRPDRQDLTAWVHPLRPPTHPATLSPARWRARGQEGQQRLWSSLCVAPVWLGLHRAHHLSEEPPGGKGKNSQPPPKPVVAPSLTHLFQAGLDSWTGRLIQLHPAHHLQPEGGWKCFAGGWHCGWPAGLSVGSLPPALALIMTTLTISLKRIKPRR